MDITHVMPVGLALIMALSGCAAGRMDAVGPEPRPLGRDFPTYRAPVDPTLSTRPPVEEPEGTLSLPEVLRAALLHNPELSATAFEVRTAEARTLQAGLLPNPELELELENFGGTGEVLGVNASESTFQLSQLIELGGSVRGGFKPLALSVISPAGITRRNALRYSRRRQRPLWMCSRPRNAWL